MTGNTRWPSRPLFATRLLAGFNNTSTEDVVLVWGWMGAGSIEDSGYEVHPESNK